MLSIIPTRLFAYLGLATLLGCTARASTTPEDELKAAVVLSFLRYGDWHPALPPSTPLTVGVLGRLAFAEVLRHVLEGRLLGDHPIHVIELKTADEQHGCQILYFAEERGLDTRTELQKPSVAHVLTIGETRDFLDWGGAVNLFVLDGHIAFEVSLEALERGGVSISSRLLRFGQIRSLKKGARS